MAETYTWFEKPKKLLSKNIITVKFTIRRKEHL